MSEMLVVSFNEMLITVALNSPKTTLCEKTAMPLSQKVTHKEETLNVKKFYDTLSNLFCFYFSICS